MYAPGRPDPIEAGNSQISVCYVFSLLELLESIGLSRENTLRICVHLVLNGAPMLLTEMYVRCLRVFL